MKKFAVTGYRAVALQRRLDEMFEAEHYIDLEMIKDALKGATSEGRPLTEQQSDEAARSAFRIWHRNTGQFSEAEIEEMLNC